jgi:hypothetical protein
VDGNAYFAADLGQVLRRTPQGVWTNLDTGTLDTLTSLLVDESNIYASSFQHRLFASTDGGASWTNAPVPVAPNVTSIARLPNGDFVAATEATADTDAVTILRGPELLALPATPWTTLETVKVARGQTRPAAILSLTDRLIVLGRGAREFHGYDIASDRWGPLVATAWIVELHVNRAAGLLYGSGPVVSQGIALSGLSRNNGVLSTDGGRTWVSINPGRHAALGFRDAMNGIAVVADLAMLKPEFYTATTADGGKTWTRVGGMVPGFCTGGAYLPPTDELLCMRNDGNIQSTRTGEEWVVERAVF